MKIRTSYVSNSSSSSFVLYSANDLDYVVQRLFDYMKQQRFESGEHIPEALLHEVIVRAVAAASDTDIIRRYVYNSIYYAMTHYEWYRQAVMRLQHNPACLQCADNCKFQCGNRECGWWFHLNAFNGDRAGFLLWAYRSPIPITKDLLKTARKSMQDSKTVYELSDGTTQVYADPDWDELQPMLDRLVDQWMDAHPTARVLEFYSDGGNPVEAEVRYNLELLSNILNSERELGFYADNS